MSIERIQIWNHFSRYNRAHSRSSQNQLGRNHCELKRMHLTYCSLCWTTPDLDNLDAMAALSTHSIWIAWLLMVLLTAICILLPYAHLAAHACLPAEIIIRTTWPASPKDQRVIQAIMAIYLLKTAFCQRCFCSMVTTPMLSANGT